MKFPVIFRVMGGLTLLPALGALILAIIALAIDNHIRLEEALIISAFIGISIAFIAASFIWLLGFKNSYFFLYLCAGLALFIGLGVATVFFLFEKNSNSNKVALVSVFSTIHILYAVFLFLISISATVKQWLQQLPDPKKEKFNLMWLLVLAGILLSGPLVVVGLSKFVKTETELWPGEITVTYMSGVTSIRALNDHNFESGYLVNLPAVREQADGISFKLHFDEPKIVDKIRIVNTKAHLEEAYIIVNNTDLKKIIFTIHDDTSIATLEGISLTDLEIKPTRLNNVSAGASDIYFKEIHLLSNVSLFNKSYEYIGYSDPSPSSEQTEGDNSVVPEEFLGEEYYEGEGEGYDGEDAELGDGVIEPMGINQYNSKQTLTNDKLPDFFKPGFNQWLDWKHNLMVIENEPIQINNNAVGTYYGGTASLTWLILPRCFKRYNAEYENNNLSDEQCVQNYTGINPFLSKSKDGKELNRVNPEIVIWATNNLIPEPGTVFYDYDVGDVYHKIGRRFFRLMALSHNYIVNSEGFEDDKKEYQEKIGTENFEAVSYFRGKYSDVLTDYALQDNYSKMGPPEAISFWLRRSIDGTEDELYAAVVKVLKTHDKEWYTNTIQK